MSIAKGLYEDFLARWKASGGETRAYRCSHCKKDIERNVPRNPGEVWDSAMACVECGKFNFVITPHSGKIKVKKMHVGEVNG